jgi:Ctr copper transporter family
MGILILEIVSYPLEHPSIERAACEPYPGIEFLCISTRAWGTLTSVQVDAQCFLCDQVTRLYLQVLFVFVCILSLLYIATSLSLTQMPIMHHIAGRYVLLAFLIAGVLAHDNGMDMNMDQGMSMSVGNMIMYLHFKLGDNLWFPGWAPHSAGAMAGTCIGLLMLSIAERWLAAIRGVMEAHWRTRFGLPQLHTFASLFSDASAMQCPGRPCQQAQQVCCGVVP